MDNNHVSAKKSVGGLVLDILTIGMLFASFAALFYSGFVLQSTTFPLGAMCAITAVGLLLLFFIGTVSCLSSKAKKNSLTAGFLAFSAIQLVALIVNFALLLGLMVKLFSVETMASRLTYVITVSLVLIGYVASISYFSGSSEKIGGDEDSEDDAVEDAEEEEFGEESEDESQEDSGEEVVEEAEEPESEGDELSEIIVENTEITE